MTDTPRLGIPELEEDQAAPETSVNEGFLVLELFSTRCIVKDRDLNAAPGAPTDGDSYLVAAGVGGGDPWAGQAGNLAHRFNGTWIFREPKEGFEIEVEDEDSAFTYRGGTWASSSSSGNITMTASEALLAAQFVNVHASAGVAKIRKANATDDTKPVNGFVPANIGNGASGLMTPPGGVVSGLVALSPGATYYLDTAGGAITDTPPAGAGNVVQEVGVAISATALLFYPKMGVTL